MNTVILECNENENRTLEFPTFESKFLEGFLSIYSV